MHKRYLALVALAAAVFARPVLADPPPDCGQSCSDCGFFGAEGVGFKVGGKWKMRCTNLVGYCDPCSGNHTRANFGRENEALLLLLRSGDEASVRTALAANAHRLRVSTTRNFVVIYGTKCDDDAIDAVAYVSAARAQFLQHAGLRSFTEQLIASR